MDEIRKLEAEKLICEIEESKQRMRNIVLDEKLKTLQVQNQMLEERRLSLEIKKLEGDISMADVKRHILDNIDMVFIKTKEILEIKKEVWYTRAKKEGAKLY